MTCDDEVQRLAPACPRDAVEGKGPQRRPQKRLDKRLEEVAEAVGGGYCWLQMPWKLALDVRETVARHRLGALEGGGGAATPICNASLRLTYGALPPPVPCCTQVMMLVPSLLGADECTLFLHIRSELWDMSANVLRPRSGVVYHVLTTRYEAPPPLTGFAIRHPVALLTPPTPCPSNAYGRHGQCVTAPHGALLD